MTAQTLENEGIGADFSLEEFAKIAFEAAAAYRKSSLIVSGSISDAEDLCEEFYELSSGKIEAWTHGCAVALAAYKIHGFHQWVCGSCKNTPDMPSDSFKSYFLRKLRRVAYLYKGTNMGGFLQGAYYHLEATQGALNDSDEYADELRKENADMRTQLQAIAAHIQGIGNLCDMPVTGFETTVKDQSGFFNVMAAQGVEPYSKRVKG